MKFNLIIEGCDCTGKTSLIGQLMKSLKYKNVIKCSNQENKKEGKKFNEDLVKFMNIEKSVIFDRATLSEDIYPEIMKRYKINYMRQLEKKVLNHNILIVLTVGNDEILKKRFDGEYITEKQLLKIRDRYEKLFPKLNYKHKILIDTSNKNTNQIINIIYDYILKNCEVN